MRAITRTSLWLLGAAILCALAAPPARANPSLPNPWSVTSADGTLSAEANFAITDGQIVVTVTNDVSAATIRSVGQAVSDVIFTISNSPGTLGIPSAAGSLVDLTPNTPPAQGSTVSPVGGTPDHWITVNSPSISGNTITLEAIGNHGGGTANSSQLIFPTDISGTYPNTNPGIDQHNPYTDGPGTFTLPLSGVTALTTITAVSFSFGTGPDITLTGTSGPPGPPGALVPEPSTLVIGGLGGLAFLGYGLRKRLKN